MTQKELFSSALGISAPYYIESINFDIKNKRLDIYIDFKRGSSFRYSDDSYDEICKAFDTKEKRWRHLNFFEHECYLIARVPRVKLADGKVRQLTMPWEGHSPGFTLLFEALAIELCKSMPISQVGALLNESDDKFWRMLHYYVDTARESEDFTDVVSVGVDETSKKKHHDYIALFVDLVKRKTIYNRRKIKKNSQRRWGLWYSVICNIFFFNAGSFCRRQGKVPLLFGNK